MKYYGENIENYEDILFNVDDYNFDVGFNVALTNNISDVDFNDFVRDYADEAVVEFKAEREKGIVLNTTNGLVHGHFVGQVKYGDEEMGMAFRTDNGQIVCAYLFMGEWELCSLKDVCGTILWDVYPKDWDVYWTRPESVKRPREPKRKTFYDFVDTQDRTDLGEFLYVVRDSRGYNQYLGHYRSRAAKAIKELRRSGSGCDIEVWPVHCQHECWELPF